MDSAVPTGVSSCEVDRFRTIEESITTIKNDLGTFVSEISDIKNNLVLISEIITKLATTESIPDVGNKNYKMFGKFVEDSLDKLPTKQAEAAVLGIVEILHKYKTLCDS